VLMKKVFYFLSKYQVLSKTEPNLLHRSRSKSFHLLQASNPAKLHVNQKRKPIIPEVNILKVMKRWIWLSYRNSLKMMVFNNLFCSELTAFLEKSLELFIRDNDKAVDYITQGDLPNALSMLEKMEKLMEVLVCISEIFLITIIVHCNEWKSS
jgi:hypothetical protein